MDSVAGPSQPQASASQPRHEQGLKSEAEQEALQEHLLLLLGDSNLPTGGFVASAGLESFAAHCLLRSASAQTASAQMLSFLAASLASYARSVMPYLLDAHALAQRGADAADALITLDVHHEASLLSTAARRASIAQGAALLTLHSKAFAEPLPLARGLQVPQSAKPPAEAALEAFRMQLRKGKTAGHLAVCWGLFAAALGIDAARAARMHLFLQARAMLSSAIRLNILGPYAAHSLLHHHLRAVLRQALAACGAAPGTQLAAAAPQREGKEEAVRDEDEAQGWAWDWDDEGAWAAEEGGKQVGGAPAVTWPLGEIVQARHDVLHSRMFNS